jgi:hypothetical protein
MYFTKIIALCILIDFDGAIYYVSNGACDIRYLVSTNEVYWVFFEGEVLWFTIYATTLYGTAMQLSYMLTILLTFLNSLSFGLWRTN